MAKKNGSCRGCGHPSGKLHHYGFYICNVCRVIEVDSADGKSTLIYVKTIGEKEKQYVTTIEKR